MVHFVHGRCSASLPTVHGRDSVELSGVSETHRIRQFGQGSLYQVVMQLVPPASTSQSLPARSNSRYVRRTYLCISLTGSDPGWRQSQPVSSMLSYDCPVASPNFEHAGPIPQMSLRRRKFFFLASFSSSPFSPPSPPSRKPLGIHLLDALSAIASPLVRNRRGQLHHQGDLDVLLGP